MSLCGPPAAAVIVCVVLLLLLLLHAAAEQGIAARGRWCGDPGEPPTPSAHSLPLACLGGFIVQAHTSEAVLQTFLCACEVSCTRDDDLTDPSACIITFYAGNTLRRHRNQVTSPLPVF